MSNDRARVVIVGGGPAGLAAADVLGGHGVEVTILEESRRSGGQILRRLPDGWRRPDRGTPLGSRTGSALMNRVLASRTRIVTGALVLGLTRDRELVVQESSGRILGLKPDLVLLATGGREKFIPFPGWTLPGVMATGAAQILMKSVGVLPGKNVVVAGAGVLPLIVAGQVLKNHGRVAAYLDANPRTANFRLIRAGWSSWPKWVEGGLHQARILLRGVPFAHRTRILEARGGESLEEVTAVRIDAQGGPVPGSETVYAADALAVGYGFVPNTELALAAGCALHFSADNGGWAVTVNEDLETTVPGVFAAGETVGVGGAGKAMVEGRLAGWAMLRGLGLLDGRGYDGPAGALKRRRAREKAFGALLNSLSRTPAGMYDTIPDDCVICRCEDVTFGEIRRDLARGWDAPDMLKKTTRLGMGWCQGRTCGPILHDFLTAMGREPGMPPVSARMPVKPVGLEAFSRPLLDGATMGLERL